MAQPGCCAAYHDCMACALSLGMVLNSCGSSCVMGMTWSSSPPTPLAPILTSAMGWSIMTAPFLHENSRPALTAGHHHTRGRKSGMTAPCACAATSSHFSGDSLSRWRTLFFRSVFISLSSTSCWNWPTLSTQLSSSGTLISNPSSAAACRRLSSLSTVALPMCTSLDTWSATDGMSDLMACLTRLVATTNDSLTTYVTLGTGSPDASTAHTSSRNVGALPASSASDDVVTCSSDSDAWPRSSPRKQRSWSSLPPSRRSSALVWWLMTHDLSCAWLSSVLSGQISRYFSPFSTWISSCMPCGRPSMQHAPFSSTSSTRSGALHFAFRLSSIRYFAFRLRLHRRLGLNWHSRQPVSPQPVDWQSWRTTRRSAREVLIS
mmetsp:Transcript_12146/g.29593  ORF Transcript_12146/g.29593 Transcript_12146/m.29593 type:complete len:377 (-) Transcript_12146:495-1625(-)